MINTTFVDSALEHLSSMEEGHLDFLHQKKVKALQVEFRLLKLFLWCFPQWDCDENLHFSLTRIVTTIEDICKNEVVLFTEWNSVVIDKIQECKAGIKKYREHFVSISFKSDPFTRKDTVKFLDLIHGNMNDLVVCCQAKTLEETLFLLRDLILFTPMSLIGEENYEESIDLELYVHDWANMAARLTLMQWLNEEKDEEFGEKLKCLYVDLQQKDNPCTPKFIRLCFGVIKFPKLFSRSDTLIVGEFLSRFVDFFLQNLVLTSNDYDVPMLRDGLILLLTFLADPPSADTMNHSELSFFRKDIHEALDHASHTICIFGEISMDLVRRKTTVVHFQKLIHKAKGKIEEIYVKIPRSSWSNYPRTNGLGYFESLLVYLEDLKDIMNKNKKMVPFLRHQILTIEEELKPLRLLLQDIWIMQNERKEVKDLGEEIITLLYETDLAVKSSFLIDHPIWYNLICLSFVVDKIKDIQPRVMRIKENHIVEAVVGFKHETEDLIDRLTRGTAEVDIVPIVGMCGIGKTTLAKKLFNDPLIRYHFHKRAFCNVSQEYRKRKVLLDILSGLHVTDDEVHRMSDDDDLAHLLYKRLSGYKYLIVMDDIWDINAWYDVKTSFPDHNNGSRVIFTTRISNISLLAKPYSRPYLLPFLSVDESWKLLKQKIFHMDPCPLHLHNVGKLIAKYCQGLPLAIVVIASLLKRTEKSLSHWNKVADALTSFAFSEGCEDVIRLSYKQLPEALKSCFLYLGAFCEDKMIEAKMLTKLWVAEGFVLTSGSRCSLRKVAKMYLNELGDRNLVTVTKRSCNGGIKLFRVHDLIREFCRVEAQEQNYFCFVNAHNSKLWMPGVFDKYRVCIEDGWRSFVDAKPRGPTLHSLLHYSKDYHAETSLEYFLCNFRLVQVLDLQTVEILGGFPTTVTTLVHLRYLALQFLMLATDILKIPSEISNLWNLETLLLLPSLRLKVQFPKDIWKMKRLRHVEARDLAYVALDDVSGVLSYLPDLDTFTSLAIPPGRDGEELLRRLSHVRRLSFFCSGWWNSCHECNQLPKLDILTNLASLKMTKTGEGFCYPDTLSFPLTIRKLTLESFHIHWNEFSDVIKKVPNLEVLELFSTLSSDHGKIWDVQDEEFLKIKSLKLIGLDIEEWKASIDSFPCLEELTVSLCHRLKEIPLCFGEIPTLKSISIDFCNKEVADSAIQIQIDQIDMGNESLQFQMHLKY